MRKKRDGRRQWNSSFRRLRRQFSIPEKISLKEKKKRGNEAEHKCRYSLDLFRFFKTEFPFYSRRLIIKSVRESTKEEENEKKDSLITLYDPKDLNWGEWEISIQVKNWDEWGYREMFRKKNICFIKIPPRAKIDWTYHYKEKGGKIIERDGAIKIVFETVDEFIRKSPNFFPKAKGKGHS